MRSRLCPAPCLALLIGAVTIAASRALAGNDVKVNSDPTSSVQHEAILTVDLAQPSRVVIAYNDSVNFVGNPSPLGISASLDGGLSWTDTQLAVPPDPFAPAGFLTNIFDPFLAWGPPQEMYAGYIATTAAGGGSSGIFIERSEDGGLTWSGPTTIAIDPPGGGPGYRFNDRPFMATHPAGFVNVTWIKDVGVGQPTSDIYFAFSNPPPGPGGGPFPPTGLNFTPQVIVNDNPNGFDRGNAPHLAVHPNGRVYVAWIDVDVTQPNTASGVLKLDSTLTPTMFPVFGADVNVRTIDPLPRFLGTAGNSGNDARSGSYPFVAVDPNDGTANTVYIVYAEELSPADEGDIFFIASGDGGVSWTAPVRVNDDPPGTDQFHPQMAVAFDGTIVVAWYDKRNSASDDAWDVYVTRSVDGGASFLPNLRLSDTTATTPLSSGSPTLGEYLGLALDGSDVLVGFTSSVSDGQGDIYFDRVPVCGIPAATVYCTAKVNSQGCTPAVGWSGCHPSATNLAPYLVTASNVINNKNGILFYGFGPAAIPIQGGFLCVQSPIRRTALQSSGGNPPPNDCSGMYSFDLTALVQSGSNPALVPGATVHCEYWYRDPQDPLSGSGLTDALRVTIQP